SLAQAGGTAVELGNGASYNVNTTHYNGRAYVTGSDPAPVDGLLGLILSPLPNSGSTVTCGDVVRINGVHQVPGRGALIRVITGTSLETQVEKGPVVVSLTEENVEQHTQIINSALEQWMVR